MSTIKSIVKVMESSRTLSDGYRTFSSIELDKLEALLELFKEEIKQEAKIEVLKELLEDTQ